MANDMFLLYKAEDLKKLIDKGAATIKAQFHLEQGEIRGKQVAFLVVSAEGFDKNDRSIGSVAGCPCPPCSAKTAEKF